ncbi:MAG: peptidyl-prolyl cis-trans isomerase [Candidatus Thiodiazotropha sp. (ex Monitilora ramsayi)]|nr:peptidyl-prolyl cis-trans isomerase [Candidatus Thiodiazotropha sp. (ex Monitilora ramsayi)]
MKFNHLLREPLLHFFVLGACLFLVYAWLNRGGFDSPGEIVIDASRVSIMRSQFERVWQRPPSPEELSGLIDGWLRDEVLYREGLALGLDRDDPVMRQRVAQKMRFISGALVDSVIERADLEVWLNDNPERYRIEPTYSFRQVYLDPSRHDEDTLDRALANLANMLITAESTAPGDHTLLPASLERASPAEIRRTFGVEFGDALTAIEPGSWQGPLTSPFGLHFVYVTDKNPGRVPALEEVRDAVERDLLQDRARQADDRLYETLRERYSIQIDDDVLTVLDNKPGTVVR